MTHPVSTAKSSSLAGSTLNPAHCRLGKNHFLWTLKCGHTTCFYEKDYEELINENFCSMNIDWFWNGDYNQQLLRNVTTKYEQIHAGQFKENVSKCHHKVICEGILCVAINCVLLVTFQQICSE